MRAHWKKIAIIVAIILVVGAIGWYIKKHNTQQKGYTTFYSVDQTFAVDYPRSWKAQPNQGQAGAIAVSFLSDNDSLETTANRKPYINVAKGAMTGSLDEVYQTAVGKYKKLFKDVTIISEDNERIGGVNAKKIVFTGTLGGRHMHYVIVITQYNGTIYTITAGAAPVDAKLLSDMLEVFLSTWKFVGTEGGK